MVTLITVEPGNTPAAAAGFCMSLCFSLSRSRSPSLPILTARSSVSRFFISASRLCLTSVAKFFRPATIIAPRRSPRWKRKTGFGFDSFAFGHAEGGRGCIRHGRTIRESRRCLRRRAWSQNRRERERDSIFPRKSESGTTKRGAKTREFGERGNVGYTRATVILWRDGEGRERTVMVNDRGRLRLAKELTKALVHRRQGPERVTDRTG